MGQSQRCRQIGAPTLLACKAAIGPQFAKMELIAPFFLILAGAIGFAMAWGTLSQKIGCAVLCAGPFLLYALLVIEPMITGERQSSTAGLAVPFGALWMALSAAGGALIGAGARWLKDR